MSATDALQRPLRDVRVSLTDRCNFRCTYCMPREVFGPGHRFLPREELLSFEEIARLLRIFARLGARKVRLTGGEPLLRRDVEKLVAMISEIDGIEDLSMTTNGSLLASKADALRRAGLRRVTVSLDNLDSDVFARESDTDVPLSRVLEGIEAAREANLAPIKLNAVIRRGVTDAGIEELAAFGRDKGAIVRFIEYMDVGSTNGWEHGEVVPAAEIVERVAARWPLEPIAPAYRGEVAGRYRYRDGCGEIGVIASVTQPFCGTCTRARVSAQGELFTCLFASRGTDLRALLRSDADDDAITRALATTWGSRRDRYSELRTLESPRARKIEMSYIGG